MPIKDAFEVFIKIFHRDRTEFVKDPSDFHPLIGVGIASIVRGHQQPVSLLTLLAQVGCVVVQITQDEPNFCGNFSQQIRCRLTIRNVGGSQHSGHRKSDRRDDRNDVQVPATDESRASLIWGSRASGTIEVWGIFPCSRCF